MEDSTTSPALKRCTICRRELPKTTEFFYIRTDGRVYPYCRDCQRDKRAKYYQVHKEQEASNARNYYERTADTRRAYSRKYYQEHRSESLTYASKYRERNKQIQKEKWLAKYYGNVEESRKKSRMQNAMRKDHLREYRIKNKERYRIHKQNRRAKEKLLKNDFSVADWRHAVEYFDGCCAVCGRQLRDLLGTHTAAADHWIPLSAPNCPGTTKSNMLPLCHGELGCNNSKHDRDPIDWLVEKYGKRRAREILKRIQAYFDSLD